MPWPGTLNGSSGRVKRALHDEFQVATVSRERRRRRRRRDTKDTEEEMTMKTDKAGESPTETISLQLNGDSGRDRGHEWQDKGGGGGCTA
jgi:hypothetical protein